MYLFINELSFQAQAKDTEHAKQLMNNIFSVISILKKIKGDEPIGTSRTLWKKDICKDYNINNFLKESINKDKKLLFLSVVRKGPYVETILDEKYDGFYECRLKNNDHLDISSSSIAGAALLDGILISLADSGIYILPQIDLEYRLDEEPFSETQIDNFIDSESARNYVDKFKSDRLYNISSWQELWENKDTLFPNLSFCEAVYDQLKRLDLSIAFSIKTNLSKIDNYFSSLQENETPDYRKIGVKASLESETALQKYGDQRKFKCPDGEIRTFKWHAKMLGKKNIRIYFHQEESLDNRVIIGYIGLHLQTAKYN